VAVKRSDIVEDEHTFLVLDKRLQGIPWESTPLLRGRAVSRIPSTAFLLDRLYLASMSEKLPITTKNQAIDRISVDPTKAYYLLNPEGDLKRTEETFTPWLKSMNKVGWAGIIGRRPAEFELKDALNRRDLFM
jgi:separase